MNATGRPKSDARWNAVGMLWEHGLRRNGGRTVAAEGVENFDAWYTSVRPKLLATLGGANVGFDTAQDAVDEALTRAYERWDEVSVMRNPDGWAYVVARNALRTVLRRQGLVDKVRRLRSDEDDLPDTVVEFHSMLEPLSPRHRHVVVLRYVFGMTEPEIAEALGLNRGTVSSRLRRAHAVLRGTLPVLVALWGWT